MVSNERGQRLQVPPASPQDDRRSGEPESLPASDYTSGNSSRVFVNTKLRWLRRLGNGTPSSGVPSVQQARH